MRFILKIIVFFFLFIQISCGNDDESSQGNFENYLLALSWSPTYCLTHSYAKDAAQCNSRKKYNMVVHGLWPQSIDKHNPAFSCKHSETEASAQTITAMFDIMPSAGLIQHQWRKHGTCSGYSSKEYFAKIDDLYDKFNIRSYFKSPIFMSSITNIGTKNNIQNVKITPDDIIKNIQTNTENISADNIIITCSGRMLSEVRLCLNKDFTFRKCSGFEKSRSCKLKNIYLPRL